jgi:AcrR family transcriptional regulator
MHHEHLKRKALELRTERRLTIDQIAERLAISRSTIYHWVRDLPVEIERPRLNAGQGRGAARMSEKHRLLREEAYAAGVAEFDSLCEDPTFRDFVCMYIGEGYKRSRNTVAICNSDPAVVRLGADWIRHQSCRKIDYAIQFHADQDLVELVRFWADYLEISPELIKLQRKSNSNRLRKRTWRSEFGVLTVRTGDTMFRARLQAWMDLVRASWTDEIAARVEGIQRSRLDRRGV